MLAFAAASGRVTEGKSLLFSASAVAIGGAVLAIEGKPGSGKSSLALALIDRGAKLIGDDAVRLSKQGDRLIASPPPNIEGLIELRGIGLFELPLGQPCPLALIVSLGAVGERQQNRLPDRVPRRELMGVAVPCLAFDPGTIAPAVRAEMALVRHGLQVQ